MEQTPGIVLAYMPFGPVEWPSTSLGTLSAALRKSGLACTTTYPALRFAEQIGYELYAFVCGSLNAEMLLHDWLFSAHVASAGDPAAYVQELNRLIDGSRTGKLTDEPLIRRTIGSNPSLSRFFDADGSLHAEPLIALREMAAGFVTRTAEAIVAKRPTVVGCTTTFMQFNASVSLVKEVKRLDPSVVTVLGGAGVEAEMGYQAMRRFPFVDLVFSGEADTLFPAVCMDLLAGADLAAIAQRYPAGLLARPFVDGPHHREEAARRWQAPLETDLDALPVPDYHDYFAELAAGPLTNAFQPPIPAESSRGCWKGAAQHCAFCGMQGARMGYRSKSPERVIAELDELHHRHGNDVFLMTDTIIPMRYFKTALPALAEEERPFSLFYEVPPKLTEEQVRQLAEAKVWWIQPGIESLDDRLLRLMNKGNRAIRNIETLKYCLEQGINVRWNILYNVPGEDEDCYRRMERLVPWIVHFPPPLFVPIRFDRFSPYHTRKASFGLALRPIANNKFVYPFDDREMAEFSAYFESEEPKYDPRPRSPAKVNLASLVLAWRQVMLASPAPPQLIQHDLGAGMTIADSRPSARSPLHRLNSEAAAVYRLCRSATTVAEITRALANGESPIHRDMVSAILAELREAGLALEIDGEWLALASRPPTRPLTTELGGQVRRNGKAGNDQSIRRDA